MLTEDDLELMWSDIKAKMVQVEQNGNAVERADEEVIEDGDRIHNGTAIQRQRTRESIFDDFDDFNNVDDSIDSDDDVARTQDQVLRNRCDLELSTYKSNWIKQSLKSTDGKLSNPLLWWKENQSQFPILAKLARDFLSIPATSAPSERVWSRAANVLTLKRANLSPEVASRIMFIRENKSALIKNYEAITGDSVNEVILPMMYDLHIQDEEDVELG